MLGADKQRLKHIISYCDEIDGFILRFGDDYDVFISDRAYFNAVTMCILQIGELSGGLSEEFREATKGEMPWGLVRGMRNLLAHNYGNADEATVWETAKNDIPLLKQFCEKCVSASE